MGIKETIRIAISNRSLQRPWFGARPPNHPNLATTEGTDCTRIRSGNPLYPCKSGKSVV